VFLAKGRPSFYVVVNDVVHQQVVHRSRMVPRHSRVRLSCREYAAGG
jgi:hypothetical protein